MKFTKERTCVRLAACSVYEEKHEKEPTDEKPDSRADPPLLRDKADKRENEEYGNEGRHGHDEHPSCAEPPHQFGEEKNLERSRARAIESHDITDANWVKVQTAHDDGHVEEEWEQSVYWDIEER